MITRFNYRSLRREEQHMFNVYVLQILDATCGACGKVYDSFKESADRLDFLLQGRASKDSLSLAVLDYAADEAWSGLNLQIQASMKHPDQSVRDAAGIVDEVFSQTPNPTRLNYDQEYGTLSTLLGQLRRIDADTLHTALVDVYIDYLSYCVDEFVSAANHVNDTKSKQIVGEFKDASEQCYKCWTSLVKYLEAMHSADALKEGENCVARLDTLCKRVKNKLAQRPKSPKENEISVFDDIKES